MTDEPLPEWAERRCQDGESGFQERAQLCTRDGRTIGNARVVCIVRGVTYKSEPGLVFDLAVVRTDMGNELRLLESELDELFYPPQWIMKP